MRTYSLFIALLLLLPTFGQQLMVDWQVTLGGAAQDGMVAHVHEDSHVYVSGFYTNSLTTRIGDSVVQLNKGGANTFMAKLDADGKTIWIKDFEHTGIQRVGSIKSDGNGDLIVAGMFIGSLILKDELKSQSSDRYSIFVAKLNTDGEILMNISFGGESDTHLLDMAIGPNGKINLFGMTNYTVDFDPSTKDFFLLKDKTLNTNFPYWAQYDNNGNFLNAIALRSSDRNVNNIVFSCFAIDANGNAFFGGNFKGEAFFNNDISPTKVQAYNENDAYVCRYDENFNFKWVRSFKSTAISSISSLCATKSGSVVAVGVYSDSIGLIPNTNPSSATASKAMSFITKLDSSGNATWSKSFGGTGNMEQCLLSLGADDDVYIHGYYGGEVDFDPTTAEYYDTTNASSDQFLLKCDELGTLVWMTSLDDTCRWNLGNFEVDKYGNIFLSGFFWDMLRVFNSSDTTSISLGSVDAFVAKIEPCKKTSFGTLEITVNCKEYVSPSGRVYNESGTYFDYLRNSFGCDSIISINLVVNNNFLFQSEVKTCDSFYWEQSAEWYYQSQELRKEYISVFDCDSVYTLSLDLDSTWCNYPEKPISTCNTSWSVFPNPTNTDITLDLGKEYVNVNLELFDVFGKLVTTSFYKNNQVISLPMHYSNGIYMLRVRTEEGECGVKKVVKQ